MVTISSWGQKQGVTASLVALAMNMQILLARKLITLLMPQHQHVVTAMIIIMMRMK
jgi:hypothetical protein